MEYYIAMKKNELLLHKTMWANLNRYNDEQKKSHQKKNPHHMISLALIDKLVIVVLR